MCRDISRDNYVLVWQCINFKTVIKYVENLKSRIYKAFCSKAQRTQAQFIWLNSPLVMILALKNAVLATNLYLSSFEIGYLIFCLRNAIDLDIDFFSYYRQALNIRLNSRIQNCVAKIKHSMIISLVEMYEKYLLYMISVPVYQFYDLNAVFSFCGVCPAYEFALRIDIKYCLGSLSPLTFLPKLDLVRSAKIYLLEFLDQSIVAYAISFYVNIFLNHLTIQKEQANLTYRLLTLCLLQLCYEAFIMIDGFFYLNKPFTKGLIFVYDFSDLLILSSDPSLLKMCQKKLFSFLSFNGMKLKYIRGVLPLSLYQGLHINRVFASISSQFYPFYFAVKPSLYAQFVLMQRISALLLKSKAQPLFIIIIRFNMLILFWSNSYTNQPVKKIFCLIDYLVALKFNLFLKKKSLSSLNSRIRLFDVCLGVSNSFKIFKTFPVTIIHDAKYYKYYALAKLSYL